MKIRLDISPEVGAEIEFGEDGTTPAALILTPTFATSKGTTTLLYGESTGGPDDKRLLDRFSVAASGQNGKIVKRSRMVSTKPLCDMTDEELRLVTKKA